MYTISGEREMINHAQHVLKLHESQLAGVASYQTSGHLVPPGHVAVHKVRHRRAQLRALRYWAQHHESGPVFLLQFVQKVDLGVTGALETSLVPSVIKNVYR